MENATNFTESYFKVPVYELSLFAAFIGTLLLAACFVNFSLAALFLAHKRQLLSEPGNCLLLVLSLSNCGLCMFVLLPVLIAAFSEKWMHLTGYCEFIGVIKTFWWCVTISTLMILSYEKYHFIVHPLNYRRFVSKLKINVLLVFNILCSIMFSFMPLFGWGEYAFDNQMHCCEINWRVSRSFNHVFVCCTFVIPVSATTFFYGNIVRIASAQAFLIRRLSQVAVTPIEATNLRRKINARKALRTTALIVGTIFLCWTPFIARVHVYGYDGFLDNITNIVIAILSLVPAFVYPFYFGFRNRLLRRELKILFRAMSFWSVNDVRDVKPTDTVDEEDYPENVSRRNSRTNSIYASMENVAGFGGSRRVSWNLEGHSERPSSDLFARDSSAFLQTKCPHMLQHMTSKMKNSEYASSMTLVGMPCVSV